MLLEPIAKKQRIPSAVSSLLISCEHGGNRIPESYRHLFHGHCTLLESHCGFDRGALVMARAMARRFHAPLMSSTVSRLVVDLNRSIGHRNLHAEAVNKLPASDRQEIIEYYYKPYRAEVEQAAAQVISAQGRVIHISCHSFTDNLNGEVRHADIGLLYDPTRQGESDLCADWKSALEMIAPELSVRRNFPYHGSDDGLTTSLRKTFASDVYAGIELELNQKNLTTPTNQWLGLRDLISTSLEKALNSRHP